LDEVNNMGFIALSALFANLILDILFYINFTSIMNKFTNKKCGLLIIVDRMDLFFLWIACYSKIVDSLLEELPFIFPSLCFRK